MVEWAFLEAHLEIRRSCIISDMKASVSLRAVIDGLQTVSSDIHAYLNPLTGELITLSDDDIRTVEREDDFSKYPDWQQEMLRDTARVLSSNDFLELPSQFEIHEYDIIERFCEAVQNPGIRDMLLRKIRGSGAFQRFKETIEYYGIEEDWYRFKEQAYKEIAISWLESNGIASSNDMENE